ncbi:low temperature requirement protein A [uncultured Paracoccus sp.]|uniref:low temperature requirement protein A n=1 Tax=uncultured Paracoccus sp. TaxID=189685 RepID=UPI002620D23D|nr:low temperature requirement protein A [uncultured Paracoccus sp.]
MVHLPALPARNPAQHHRAATQLELFFDLVFVIAIASVTAALHHGISGGHGIEVLPRFLFLFISIWWSWMNFTWFASAFDNDGPLYRLLTMTIMIGALIFAGGAGHIFETLDMQWGVLGWCIMRVAMALLWLRASSNPAYRATCRRFAAGILIAQVGWILVYLLCAPGSTAFFIGAGLVFLIEFSVPVFAERAGATPFHRHHIIERYGLLTIISMGEIMLAISVGFSMMYGEDGLMWPGVVALGGAVMVLAIFWLYFTEEDHLPRADTKTAFIWGYSHVFIFGSVAVLGAGVAAELDLASDHSKATPAELAMWLGLPLAVFMLALWVARDRHFHHGIRSLALPVMAGVSVVGAFLDLPTWGFALIAVVAVLWRCPIHEPAPEAGTVLDHGQPASDQRH